MFYKIKIADGDTIIYETDLTLEQLKSYISNNDFIEIPRNGTVNIKNGVRFVPTFASYRTTSIVYINHDKQIEEARESNNKIRNEVKPIINEIFKHQFNKRMKLWLWWHISDGLKSIEKEDLYSYNAEYLRKILNKCKKYKCKLK